ncbi:hypothetical protein H2201_003270 [Coniosporium apollinis]|uniref:Transcription initiation factor IIE subunit beta n=1 Tax=Coniosporium apollinis TaxID=61459 RepID=A0ABQ9NY21_9PEZI|nr:hypothetical protein H2201_003270 [Coniosporium apollinis]
MSSLKTPAGPISIPSPTPSTSSNGTKRKRETGPPPAQQAPVFNGGQEVNIHTHVHYAIAYLQNKDRALSFDDILNYLSLRGADPQKRKALRHILTLNPRVEFDPKGNNGAGSFRYRPIHPVRNAEELKRYLQSRKDANGIPVKELKEGWPGAVEAIDALEAAGELLVTRNRKDNTPKQVWQNDPTLKMSIDEDLKAKWHAIMLPATTEELRVKLEQVGMKPTTAPPAPKEAPKPKEKKKRKQKSGARITNTHMQGVLIDYSNRRR